MVTLLGLYHLTDGRHVGDVTKISTSNGRPLRILAFGDSLTEGYMDKGRAWWPYSSILCKHLGTEMSQVGKDVYVKNEGMSGELAVHMVDRLPIVLSDQAPSEQYDVAVILAGTNDLFNVMMNPAGADHVWTGPQTVLSFARVPIMLIVRPDDKCSTRLYTFEDRG